MSSILSVGTALPPIKADCAAIRRAARIWLEGCDEEFALFERFLSSTKTESRHFVISPEEIVKLPGLKYRSELFEKYATELSVHSLQGALDKAEIAPHELDGLIFTSCSCPLIPSPDTYLVERLGLRRDITRIPSYQFGCAGGVIGLGVAHKLSSLKNIAVVSTELCSLVFQPENRSPSHLVGAALFGDGSGAVIVSHERRGDFEILDHRSFLIPESRHLMGYDIQDNGPHLRLDRELPGHLIRYIPSLVDEFLKTHGYERSDVPWWLFHPGSDKILTQLNEVLGVNHSQSYWSKKILRHTGNLSSATILFVLESFLNDRTYHSGDLVVMVGIGPGLTVETVLGRNS